MTGRRRVVRGRMAAVLVGIGMVATAFTVASPSHASFPGTNGLIAFVQAGNVFVVDPVNPVPTQITNTANYTRAKWNAAGNKLVADQTAGLVLLDPVAGSAVTPVPNTTGADNRPAFDPTGTKIAFRSAVGLTTIDVTGANRTNILNSATATQPDWSADGTFIAFAVNIGAAGNAIQRIAPTGGNVTTLAATGPAGANVCNAATPCQNPSVKPDNSKVAFNQTGAANAGLAEVNSNGTTVTPIRLTTGANDTNESYAPDGTQLSFARATNLSRVPSDGSGVVTAIGAIAGLTWTNWGRAAGTGTGTGTGTSVISVAAVRNGANCVFNITATPAAAGITVDFSITNPKGVVKATGNDVTVPSSPSIKAKKRGKNKVRNIALSDPKGATLGTSTATCAK